MSTRVDPKQPAAAPIGRVISVRGSQASVGLPAPHPRFSDDTRATVGKFLGIDIGKAILIGVVTDVFIEWIPAGNEQDCHATAHLDLVGKMKDGRTARRTSSAA